MDKKELIKQIQTAGMDGFSSEEFLNVDETLRGDKEVCLEAILQNVWNFRFISDEMKNNLEVIFHAFKINPGIWKYVDESKRKDKSVILQAISHLNIGSTAEWALDILPDELKTDRDIIFALLGKGATAKKYFEGLDESLKNDRNFVLEAVRRNGKTIHFFSKEFLKDREVVCEALKNVKGNGRVAEEILENIEEIKPEFFADKELMTLAAKKWAQGAFYYATDEVREDRNFILAAAEQSMEVLVESLPKELRSDKEVLERVMQRLGRDMERAMTVPSWLREFTIKGWRVPVYATLPYSDIITDYTDDILSIIEYFDSDLLEEYKEVLAEYSEENFLTAEDIRECAEEKSEEEGKGIELIASILQQKQEERALKWKAEKEKRDEENKARKSEKKKEESQETKAEADERTAEIKKAIAGLEALNLTAEEINNLTAQLAQLKANQRQNDIKATNISKGEQ